MNSRLHRWWLWGCFAALLLTSVAGGFGVAVTAVFIGIYLTGLVLIGPDEPEAEAGETDEAVEPVETDEVLGEDPEPYPDGEETETTHTDSDTHSDESLESSESSRS
jgi:hypothetical protein